METNEREEAKRLLAERSPEADLLKEGPPGSDKKYVDLALEVGDMKALNGPADKLGNTALILAVHRGENALGLKLIKAGVNLEAQNPTILFTALHFASRSKKEGAGELMKALLAAGADPNKKDIDGRYPVQHAIESNNFERMETLLNSGAVLSTRQRFVISAIKRYLTANSRDQKLLSPDGYCNGFAFLSHRFDSQGNNAVLAEILRTIVMSPVTPESLAEPLTGLVAPYGTRGNLFEAFLSQLTYWFDPIKFTVLRQQNRQSQMAMMGEAADFNQLIRYLSSGELTKGQLIEVLEMLRHLPGNTRFEITGAGHATAFKINGEHQFEYWDSEFESSAAVKIGDAKSFAELIIQTKYHDMGQPVRYDLGGNEIIDDFQLQGYYFTHENVPLKEFNYFHPDELPRKRETAEEFIASSPCGFSQFHVAVLTNSVDNFRQLLEQEFASEYLLKPAVAFNGKTPLEILFNGRNREMMEVFFSKLNSLSLDADVIQGELYNVLFVATGFINVTFENEDRRFFEAMIGHLRADHLKNLLVTMIYANKDLAAVDAILSCKNFNRTSVGVDDLLVIAAMRGDVAEVARLFALNSEKVKAGMDDALKFAVQFRNFDVAKYIVLQKNASSLEAKCLQEIVEQFKSMKEVGCEVLSGYMAYRERFPDDKSMTTEKVREYAGYIKSQMPLIEFKGKVVGDSVGVLEVFNIDRRVYEEKILSHAPVLPEGTQKETQVAAEKKVPESNPQDKVNWHLSNRR